MDPQQEAALVRQFEDQGVAQVRSQLGANYYHQTEQRNAVIRWLAKKDAEAKAEDVAAKAKAKAEGVAAKAEQMKWLKINTALTCVAVIAAVIAALPTVTQYVASVIALFR